MFKDCKALKTAPILPATTLSAGCYYCMFENCTSLVNVQSALPATTALFRCYYGMFSGCTSLEKAPEINATTFGEQSFACMFAGCTSLETPPSILLAAELPNSCCTNMFERCTSLKTAPEIAATAVGKYSCYFMFFNCPSLKRAPALNAETLNTYCYDRMFSYCSSLEYIKCLALTGVGNTSYTSQWVSQGASGNTGTFVRNPQATWTIAYNDNAVPKGWTVVNDE